MYGKVKRNRRKAVTTVARAATERVEMRIRPDVERRLRTAAELEHVTLSAFITEAAVERADRVIATNNTWTVSAELFDELAAALDAPPVRNSALAKALVEVDKLIERR